MIELQRTSTHPGEILKEEFLEPLSLSQSHLAKALHTSFRAINELVNEIGTDIAYLKEKGTL